MCFNLYPVNSLCLYLLALVELRYFDLILHPLEFRGDILIVLFIEGLIFKGQSPILFKGQSPILLKRESPILFDALVLS